MKLAIPIFVCLLQIYVTACGDPRPHAHLGPAAQTSSQNLIGQHSMSLKVILHEAGVVSPLRLDAGNSKVWQKTIASTGIRTACNRIRMQILPS
jgi:hypothetical protein